MDINCDLATPPPLYFYYNTTDFVTTTAGNSTFNLNSKQKIELFCSDGFQKPYDNKTLTAACISGNQFQIKNKSGYLIDAMCKNYPNHTTRLSERKCVVGSIVEIGFDVRGKSHPYRHYIIERLNLINHNYLYVTLTVVLARCTQTHT